MYTSYTKKGDKMNKIGENQKKDKKERLTFCSHFDRPTVDAVHASSHASHSCGWPVRARAGRGLGHDLGCRVTKLE